MGFLSPLHKASTPQRSWLQTELLSKPHPAAPDSLSMLPSLTHPYLLPRAARACRIMHRPCWGPWSSPPQEYSQGKTLPPLPPQQQGDSTAPDLPT